MRFTETILAGDETKPSEEEDATNILLNVPSEPTDIYSALDRVLELRRDDIAGKPAELYRTLTNLPPLLQISIPRIGLSREGKAVKIEHSLRFEETLYLDRYCSNPEILPIRQACWQLRKTLQSLLIQKELCTTTRVKDSDSCSLLSNTAKFLSDIPDVNSLLEELGMEPVNVPEGLAAEIDEEANLVHRKVDRLQSEIQELQEALRGRFDFFTKEKYRLYAVFFHRGGAGGGHYWANIFDFRSDIWRTYNDETVEEHRSPGDILNAHEWSHGTPTYAVYVRDDIKDSLVQPVCRAPRGEKEGEGEEESTEATAAAAAAQSDVEMREAETSWGGSAAAGDARDVDGEWDNGGAYAKPTDGW